MKRGCLRCGKPARWAYFMKVNFPICDHCRKIELRESMERKRDFSGTVKRSKYEILVAQALIELVAEAYPPNRLETS